MTRAVNIGEAKARLSELVAAALAGEDVVLARAGEPQVRLVPVESEREALLRRRGASRQAAFGKFAIVDIPIGPEPAMTDGDVEERWQRKFGPVP